MSEVPLVFGTIVDLVKLSPPCAIQPIMLSLTPDARGSMEGNDMVQAWKKPKMHLGHFWTSDPSSAAVPLIAWFSAQVRPGCTSVLHLTHVVWLQLWQVKQLRSPMSSFMNSCPQSGAAHGTLSNARWIFEGRVFSQLSRCSPIPWQMSSSFKTSCNARGHQSNTQVLSRSPKKYLALRACNLRLGVVSIDE